MVGHRCWVLVCCEFFGFFKFILVFSGGGFVMWWWWFAVSFLGFFNMDFFATGLTRFCYGFLGCDGSCDGSKFRERERERSEKND